MSNLKDESVEIMDITSTVDKIYGLGDDGLVYYWEPILGKWLKNWNHP